MVTETLVKDEPAWGSPEYYGIAHDHEHICPIHNKKHGDCGCGCGGCDDGDGDCVKPEDKKEREAL